MQNQASLARNVPIPPRAMLLISVLQYVALVCGLVALACGPESARDEFRDNVRTVCAMNEGICYEQDALEEEVDDCVERWGDDSLEKAVAMSDHCAQIYMNFFACAADWDCEDFLSFPEDKTAPCQDQCEELNAECPGLSPYYQDHSEQGVS